MRAARAVELANARRSNASLCLDALASTLASSARFGESNPYHQRGFTAYVNQRFRSAAPWPSPRTREQLVTTNSGLCSTVRSPPDTTDNGDTARGYPVTCQT